MITFQYRSDGWRPVEEVRGLKIIDIGVGGGSFAESLDAVVDIREPPVPAPNRFIGDINEPEIWNEIFKHVKKHGKWDYAICAGTLEDILNPFYVCKQIEKIADAGFIFVPSKYRELARFMGTFRGWIHHLWVFDVVGGKLTGYPKINYLEDPVFDDVHKKLPDHEELLIEWAGEIGMKIVHDGIPYGTAEMSGEDHIRKLYNQLIEN